MKKKLILFLALELMMTGCSNQNLEAEIKEQANLIEELKKENQDLSDSLSNIENENKQLKEKIEELNSYEEKIEYIEDEAFSYSINEIVYDVKDQFVLGDYFHSVQNIEFHEKELNETNNQFMKEYIEILNYNEKFNGSDYTLHTKDTGDEWRAFISRQIRIYDNLDTITLIVEDTTHANHTGGLPRKNYSCFHIDKKTKEFILNTDLLSRNGYDIVELQNSLYNLLEGEDYKIETDLEAHWKVYGAEITNDSCIFIENDKMNIYVTVGALSKGYINICIEL